MWTHQLNTPSEQSSLEVLVVGELTGTEDPHGIHDRKTSVQFPTRRVVVQDLGSSRQRVLNIVLDVPPVSRGTYILVPLNGVLRHALFLHIGQELIHDQGKDVEKVLSRFSRPGRVGRGARHGRESR